jgi:hypothetical protein
MAAKDLEHPRRIAVAGLGQGGADVCPFEANVAQEVVVQFAERDDLPTVPGRARDGGGME